MRCTASNVITDTYSLHALLLCDDPAGMLRRLWKGVPVDDEHLALELTRSVGLRGNYLAERHTANHSRQNYWNSRYFSAELPLNSGLLPDEDLIERIDAGLRNILETHRSEPMPEATRKEFGAILEKFGSG
ncbi:MAG: trimethylamine methyltransferase family protein [Deltaproteobacteria bacterium]|nr:trimethylamine methyltransferase family protein [Deltaproteobacteria bacterium]